MKIYKLLSFVFVVHMPYSSLSSCRNSDSTETEDTTPGNLPVKFEKQL
jgi:hypothetical protein